MKNRRTYSHRLLRMLLLLFAGIFALGIMSFGIRNEGGSETYIQTLSGSSLVAGASCEVKDDKFQDGSIDWNSITNLSVNDVITFEIRQDTGLYYYDKPFTATVNLKIQYYTSPDQATPTELDNVKLQVRYDTIAGVPYPGMAMFKFSGAYRVKVTVNSISSTELGDPLPAIFRLKNEIFITRKYPFTGSNSDVTYYSLDRNRLTIHWNPANYPGAEQYDLEWQPVDDSSAAAASIRKNFTSGSLISIPDDTLDAWFYHHASRITTPAFGYTLNLPYSSGYLIYRVRGVQTGVNGTRKTTTWCYKALQGSDTGSAAVAFQGMNDSLNWQYTGAFAEDGKRKEVISYFDGTLRNRQSVTLNNSENKSIIGETIYDAMGRPAVQVLPVPTTDSVLQYFPSFNRNTAGSAPYNYTDLGQSTVCDITAQPMSITSGASEYYSSGNPFPKTNEYFFNKYIPDADGYPFSVTAYTADNTGRISRQGGVGPAFQLGSGHETRYYYGKPQQSELDRLFGSEAGNAQHFLKNMVVDPNGQVSVSYINANGKTVATALAGTAPGNLHPLPGAGSAAVPDTSEMIQPGSLTYNTGDYSITAASSFNVPVNGNYNFTYQVDPLSLNTAYGPDKTLQICSDCYYDLLITVTDNCGQVVHTETHDAGMVFDTLCIPPPISGNFSLENLAIGSYNVAYKLQVSKAALDFYDNRFVRVNTDLKTLADFTRSQLKNTDFGNCFADCKTCKETLGTRAEFTARFTGLFETYNIDYDADYQAWLSHLYDSLYAHCLAIQCPENTSPCNQNYRIMLLDVTPGGQYALYDSAYNLLEPEINVLQYYTTAVFTDENGRLDSVPDSQGNLVPPSQLTLPEFIRNFKSSWADSLVTHHPEYCFYKWCLANSNSKEYDDYIKNGLPDAAAARTAGLFDPDNFLALFQNDPFFQSTGMGYYLAQKMQDSLTYYSKTIGMPYDSGAVLPEDLFIQTRDPDIPLYQASHSITFNQGFASIADDAFKAIIIPGGQYKHGGYYDILGVAKWAATCGQLGMPIDSCVVCKTCINEDLVWKAYKLFYLQMKSRMYREAMADSDNPYFQNCKNCYIGTDGVNGVLVSNSAVTARRNDEAVSRKTQLPFNRIASSRKNAGFARPVLQAMETSSYAVSDKEHVTARRNDEAVSSIKTQPPFNEIASSAHPQSQPFGFAMTRASGYAVNDNDGGPNPAGYFEANTVSFNSGESSFNNLPILSSAFDCPSPADFASEDEGANISPCASGDHRFRINQNGGSIHHPNSIIDVTVSFKNQYDQIVYYFIVSFYNEQIKQYYCVPGQIFDDYPQLTHEITSVYCRTQSNCPNGTYTDASGSQVYIEQGSSTSPPANVPSGYGNCTFYDHYSGVVQSDCVFDNVWACPYSSPPPFSCPSANDFDFQDLGDNGVCATGDHRFQVDQDNGGTDHPNTIIDVTISFTSAEGQVPYYFTASFYNGQTTKYHCVPKQVFDGYPEVYGPLTPGITSVVCRTESNCADGTYTDASGSQVYIEQGSSTSPPANVPSGYGNCTFYDHYSGVEQSGCVFDNVWVCQQLSQGSSPPPSSCPDDPLAPLYAGKRRVYNDYTDFSSLLAHFRNTDTAVLKQENRYKIDSMERASVAYMADVWMARLSRCTADTSLLAQLRRGLIAVAQKAVDPQHPEGASTLPPGVTASADGRTYTGFDDVIIQVLGISAVNDSCTSDLIAAPYPYDKQSRFTDISVVRTNSDICARLTVLQSEYQASGYGGTFHEYLQQHLGSDYRLTETQLIELEQSCTVCHYLLKESLILPAVFAPGAPYPLTCSDVQTSLDEIAVKYPALDENDPYYPSIVKNYINHKYGFSLAYYDYLHFAEDACPANSLAMLYNQAAMQEPALDTNSCVATQFSIAVTNAAIAYQNYIDSVHRDFREAFLTKCMNVQPRLTMTSSLWEYQYTLYYYDQAGNLVKTVPPKGVHLLSHAGVDSVQLYRKYGRKDCYLYSNYYILDPPTDTAAYFQFGQTDRYYSGNDPFTMEMWIRLSDFSDQGLAGDWGQISYGDTAFYSSGISLYLKNGKLNFLLSRGKYRIRDSIVYSGQIIGRSPELQNYMQTGKWTQVVAQSTGGAYPTVSLYVNGTPLPVTYPIRNQTAGSYNAPNTYLTVGAARDSSNELYGLHNASVKQFRYYKRYLSYQEIRQDLFSTCVTPSNHTALSLWAPLNDTTIKDLSGGPDGEQIGDPIGFTLNQTLRPIYPKHALASYYTYNSLNEVVRQTSPDGGTTQHWYDRLGRLLASQNSEQRHLVNGGSANRYSYTKYDALGRIIEVGEKSGAADLDTLNTKDSAVVNNWLASGTNGQVTYTRYDTPYVYNADITPYQTNLRKRVAAVFRSEDGNISNYDAATHYSYDIAGNVKTLWQDIPELETIDPTTGLKRIDYDYDIISGKVNEVSYQKGKGDQFFYKYTYDADNRVIALETSRDGLIWHNDASYRYYLHGPLARMELGTHKVQGVDYAYTLQGWLKGINGNMAHPLQTTGIDMAGDGHSSSIYAPFPRDVYGISLGYYEDDYSPIGGEDAEAFPLTFNAPGSLENTGNELFNGNISNSTITLSGIDDGLPVGYSYGYDQLNRLLHARWNRFYSGEISWSNGRILAPYKEDIAYDANGNILKYFRNGTWSGHSLAMDSLTYYYNDKTNQLNYISDNIAATNYPTDIDNQSPNNYAYDSIGNLTQVAADGVSDMTWTVYGKLKQAIGTGFTQSYVYDANNNRIIKIGQQGSITGKQYYIRDAQGNILASYSYDGTSLKWNEQDLYGSSRIGLWSWNKAIPSRVMLPQSETDTLTTWYLLGGRYYELTNHLGNVLSVITDKKKGVSLDSATVDHYQAEVLSQQDYYPFGMLEPGRNIRTIPYPYAFNGKRMENVELSITNIYDYGMRSYDARIGRFYSVDPITAKYPELSPYQFASNRPIDGVDLNGLEFRKSPGMFFQSALLTGYTTKILKPSYYMITRIRLQNLPAFYKTIGVSSKKDLEKSLSSTFGKLYQMNPPDLGPKSAREAGESVAGWILNKGVKMTPEVNAYEETKRQITQLNKSLTLVNKAQEMGLIPKQFRNDSKFQADLVNYIFDATLSSTGTGKKLKAYNKIVSYLGKGIFNNRTSILLGNYKRPSNAIEVLRPKWNLDQPSQLQPIYIQHYGKDQLNFLLKQYNNINEGCVHCAVIRQK